MATFKQAHEAMIAYTERFNRLALQCAERGQDAVTVADLDSLGAYPQVPAQWRRRMPDVVSVAPSTILEHRTHLDRALPGFCQVHLDRPDGRGYACPVGFREYTGISRREIDGEGAAR
jgi:hypothetical protein